MKPWDIFRQTMGCLTLFIVFVIGAFVGFIVFWFNDKMTPFIDQATAMTYAADAARGWCERDHRPPVVCKAGPVTIETEDKGGWYVKVWTPDRTQSVDMRVDRKGEIERSNGDIGQPLPPKPSFRPT